MALHKDSGPDAPSSSNLAHALHLSEQRYGQLVEAVQEHVVFMLDANGYVTSWNESAQAALGYTAGDIIGRPLSRLFKTEQPELAALDLALKEARQSGRHSAENWLVRQDGAQLWGRVSVGAIHDEGGALWGYSCIVRDLSELQHQYEALRESEECFRILVEGVKDCALFLLDPQGRVSSWNSGAEKIKGYKAEEIMGTHFARFYPAGDVAVGRPDALLKAAELEGSVEDEGWRLRKDGTRFWADVQISALHNANGELYGFAKVTRDMTARRRLEALETTERRINEFLESCSQQLRNPLTPIRAALTAMQAAPIDDPLQVTSRSVIQRQVSHLTALVDDLTHFGDVAASQGAFCWLDKVGDGAGVHAPLGEASGSDALRLLIVEDLPDIAEGLQMVLGLWGHEVKVAHSGQQAIDLATQFQPDVVLLDIGLPDMTGYDVAQRLRQLPGLAQTKLIALTGYGRETDKQRSFEAGLDHHVVKGSGLEELKVLLSRPH